MGCPRIESCLCPGDRGAPPGSPANTGGSPRRCVAASHPKPLSTQEKKQGGPNSVMSIAKKRHSPTPFEKTALRLRAAKTLKHLNAFWGWRCPASFPSWRMECSQGKHLGSLATRAPTQPQHVTTSTSSNPNASPVQPAPAAAFSFFPIKTTQE